jgi:hypothetical protein
MRFGSVLFLCAMVLSYGPSAYSEVEGDDIRSPDLRISEKGSELIPSLSIASVTIPVSIFTDQRFMEKLDMSVTYMASSLFFFPFPYFEISIVLDYAFLVTERILLASGIGSGIALTSGVVSVPAILHVKIHYCLLKWLRSEIDLQILMYGQGFIGEGQFNLIFKPFRKMGLYLGIGGGYGIATPYSFDDYIATIQVAYVAGYRF